MMGSHSPEAALCSPLDDGEVRVYTIDLALPRESVDRLEATLAPGERARAAAFRSPEHRRRYLVRRGALRGILGHLLGAEPVRLAFVEGGRGRPELAADGAPALRFSLSHSGDHGLVAVTASGRVGVDVERVRPLPEADAIVRRRYTTSEARALRSVPAGRFLEAFFDVWTQKEAFVKALGEGLYFDLRRVEVGVPPAPKGILALGGRPPEDPFWWAGGLAVPPGLAASLVMDRSPARVAMVRWDPPNHGSDGAP